MHQKHPHRQMMVWAARLRRGTKHTTRTKTDPHGRQMWAAALRGEQTHTQNALTVDPDRQMVWAATLRGGSNTQHVQKGPLQS